MKFSILLNTRNRVKYLENLLYSLITKTKNLQDIEVLINYDDDDNISHDFAQNKFNLNVKFFRNPRPYSLHSTINLMAKQAKGQYLIGVNDDIEFITKDWDDIIFKKIDSFKTNNDIKDDIIYCKTSCTSVDHDANLPYGSCPIVSKEAVETIGLFLYEEFRGLGGDSSIYRVYAAVDRVVDVSEVWFDHLMHNTLEKVMSPDRTAFEMRQASFSQKINPFTFDISREVSIIKNKI
jgi:glycosyltransferase involved in cell wall biosynthesis